MSGGQEALDRIKTGIKYGIKASPQIRDFVGIAQAFNKSDLFEDFEAIKNELEAFRILKKSVDVKIEYGKNKDVSVAIVYTILPNNQVYIFESVIKEVNPKRFEELEFLKEELKKNI